MNNKNNYEEIIPSVNWLPVKIDKEYILNTFTKAKQEKKWVIQIVLGTKPDFYKQFSLMYWAEKLNIPLILVTTGQHYKAPLDHGLKEFNMEPVIDLEIRGNLLEKGAELFYKMGHLARWYKKLSGNMTILPIPHGDTLSAAITASAWFLSVRQGVAQNEAGLRSMAPDIIKKLTPPFNQSFCENFIQKQWEAQWFVIRNEPYPEQWDTFVCGAGSSYFFAPHQINVEHLIREGYPPNRIVKVGNSIVDAIKLNKKPENSIFEIYPKLEEYNNWIRVDIHRRDNLVSRRFLSIVKAISKLIEKAIPIVWIELNATREALLYYGLREKILKLAEKYKNFLFTPLWENYGSVLEFWRSGKCLMELTDSGSIQEELNELSEIICCTMRFSTDRPESIFDSHSNVLIPPYSEDLVYNLLQYILNSESTQKAMKKSKKIYGNDVGKRIIEFLIGEMNANASIFQWTDETLYKLPKDDEPNYL